MKEETRKNLEVGTKALVNLIPVVGGVIASVLSDYFQSRQEKRFAEFVEGLQNDIRNNFEKINQEQLKKDDFVDIFEDTLRKVIRTRQAEKRFAFKNIIFNIALNSDVDYDETEYFIRIIDELTPVHLTVMKILAEVKEIHRQNDKTVLETLDRIQSIVGVTERRALELVEDLESYRISTGFTSHYQTSGGNGGIFYDVKTYISDKGYRFLKYINRSDDFIASNIG